MGSDIVQLEGGYLRVRREGQGRPVVLLHGWASSNHHWDGLIERLAAGYAVYAPDLYGHGDSFRAANPADFTIEPYYRSLCQWLQAERLENIALVGHSLGGHLALAYALDHPQAVTALVLVNPLLSPEQITFARVLASPFLSTAVELLLKSAPEWLIKSSLDLNRQDMIALPDDFQRQTARDYKRASSHIVRTLQTLPDLRPRLGDLSAGTLLVWGDKDLNLHPALFPALLAQIPRARGHVFAGCYHAPHLARRDEFVDLVVSFMAQNGLDAHES